MFQESCCLSLSTKPLTSSEVKIRSEQLKGGKEMASAFVLINSEIGQEEEILEDLRKIKNVQEAYVVVNLASMTAVRLL